MDVKRGPANVTIQVAVMGSIWGFSDKTDGRVLSLLMIFEGTMVLNAEL